MKPGAQANSTTVPRGRPGQPQRQAQTTASSAVQVMIGEPRTAKATTLPMVEHRLWDRMGIGFRELFAAWDAIVGDGGFASYLS
jgi:hypothetical protein